MQGKRRLLHDNFAGNDKVCFLLDRVECEDSFYLYDEGGMKCLGGHYIYYEKNADMQSYMALHIEENDVPEDYNQSRKRSINAKVHKIFFDQGEKQEKVSSNEYGLAEYIGIKKEEKKQSDVLQKRKRLPAFAYSASTFMLLAVLLGTVAVMNASGQLKELKHTISGMGAGKETKVTIDGTAKIVDVAGNVEPTKKTGDSLYSISLKMYGNISMIDSIKKTNNITDEDYIKEGETILLP